MTPCQVYDRMTDNGKRERCTSPNDMMAAELIARIGLLAQVSLDRMPLDQVDPHTFDTHTLVINPTQLLV